MFSFHTSNFSYFFYFSIHYSILSFMDDSYHLIGPTQYTNILLSCTVKSILITKMIMMSYTSDSIDKESATK